ncbi:hypothetical protein [Thermococcus sp. MV11]|uniref:hypothetical protein n=1 Tax=Thermococcus sp. MV11 TaxID=1638267 RepID=UPI001430281F|nr:hypothetical protein [Thermococcus sp. MV11]NJE03853.1 hypothetical protein [Thermococcus sp. MV11]
METLDTALDRYGRKYHAEKPRNIKLTPKNFTKLLQNEPSTTSVNTAHIREFIRNTKGCPNDRSSSNADRSENFNGAFEYLIETVRSSGKAPTEKSRDIPPRNCKDTGLNANNNEAIRIVKSDILRSEYERNSKRNRNIETLKKDVVPKRSSFRMIEISTPSAARRRYGSLIGIRIICSKVGWDII